MSMQTTSSSTQPETPHGKPKAARMSICRLLFRIMAVLHVARWSVMASVCVCWLTRGFGSTGHWRRFHSLLLRESLFTGLRFKIPYLVQPVNQWLRRKVIDLGWVYGTTPVILDLTAQFLADCLYCPRDSLPFWQRLVATDPFYSASPFCRLAILATGEDDFDYLYWLEIHTETMNLQSPADLERWKESWHACALLFRRLGRHREADRAYETILQRDPDDESARHGLELHHFLEQVSLDQPRQMSFTNDGRPKMLVSAVFWGPEFTALFCRAGLPTFLQAVERARMLSEHFDIHMVLACQSADVEQVKAHPVYPRLSRFHHSFLDISSFADTARATSIDGVQYFISGSIQAVFAQLAKQHQAALVSVPADSVFSADSCEILAEPIVRGMDAIVIPGVRTEKEGMLRVLAEDQDRDGIIAAPEQATLTAHALANLHQGTNALNMLRKDGLTLPGIMLWPVDTNAMIGHFFFLHPIYVSAKALRNFRLRSFDSIDSEFLGTILGSGQAERIEVLTDSKKTIMWELTSKDVVFQANYVRHRLLRSAHGFLISMTRKPISMYFFRHRIYFGHDKHKKFSRIERVADHWVERISRLLKRFQG